MVEGEKWCLESANATAEPDHSIRSSPSILLTISQNQHSDAGKHGWISIRTFTPTLLWQRLTSQKVALKHWIRIIRRWPVDKVRPDNVSFQKLMQHRLDKYTSTQSATKAAPNVKPNEALASTVVSPKWDESNEMRQVNALYSFLENRYVKENPMPQSLRTPASNPTHYDDLAGELQEAPSRSWFGRVVKRLKGSLRFS